MPIPERIVPYQEKDLLDKVIDQAAKSETPLSASNLNKVAVAAQVQMGIDRYRLAAKDLTEDQMLEEGHNSALLGANLEQTGKIRPPKCHAHAIVAGKHHYAAELRLRMAILKIRIDDADNGCWLPENTAATPHPAFPSAPPHSRIHRYNYFFWLFARLGNIDEEKVFRKNLGLIAGMLHEGSFPSYVMLPKGSALPTNRR